MPLMGIAKFERFFRLAAGLDVDKSDLKRYGDFVNGKIHDLLLRGQAAAKANGRVIIEPFDPPITKGLQESIHDFRNIDEQIDLNPILDHLAALPPLDLAYSSETETRLPEIAGGISVALARSFKIIDPELKNPQTEHWERSQIPKACGAPLASRQARRRRPRPGHPPAGPRQRPSVAARLRSARLAVHDHA
jgi:hypothetical protein